MDSASSATLIDKNHLGVVEVNVQRVLRPVSAPSDFRAHLRDGLKMAAESQQAGYVELESSSLAWLWFVGAVIFGAALSLIILKFRMR